VNGGLSFSYHCRLLRSRRALAQRTIIAKALATRDCSRVHTIARHFVPVSKRHAAIQLIGQIAETAQQQWQFRMPRQWRVMQNAEPVLPVIPRQTQGTALPIGIHADLFRRLEKQSKLLPGNVRCISVTDIRHDTAPPVQHAIPRILSANAAMSLSYVTPEQDSAA
jgi:hypothetical protein